MLSIETFLVVMKSSGALKMKFKGVIRAHESQGKSQEIPSPLLRPVPYPSRTRLAEYSHDAFGAPETDVDELRRTQDELDFYRLQHVSVSSKSLVSGLPTRLQELCSKLLQANSRFRNSGKARSSRGAFRVLGCTNVSRLMKFCQDQEDCDQTARRSRSDMAEIS